MAIKTDWLSEEASKAARQAWGYYMRGEASTAYLYFKQGELVAIPDEWDAAGYEIGCNEPMPRNMTADQLTRWVYDRARRLPCLPA
jgi:hypothetical protein